MAFYPGKAVNRSTSPMRRGLPSTHSQHTPCHTWGGEQGLAEPDAWKAGSPLWNKAKNQKPMLLRDFKLLLTIPVCFFYAEICIQLEQTGTGVSVSVSTPQRCTLQSSLDEASKRNRKAWGRGEGSIKERRGRKRTERGKRRERTWMEKRKALSSY